MKVKRVIRQFLNFCVAIRFIAVFVINYPLAGIPALASSPIGWAAVNSMGVESTIGGGNGDVVIAHTAEELEEYASHEDALTILVEGTLTGTGQINVTSNKTVLGAGSNATLKNAYLNLNQVSNIIIRNLTIKDSVDGIALRESHHVWVDHCDLSNCGDGLLDITHASDYVTVSWTRFSKHQKTMLINSGTSQPEDAGFLKTTVHHCWYDGSNTRNPRIGYGMVHIFNCLYNGNGYGIGLHSQARVRAEHNYFDQVKDPVKQMYRKDPASPHHGFFEGANNIFLDCTGEQENDGISFPVEHYYSYDFQMDDASEIPSIVKDGAGPNEMFGTLKPLPLPGNGAITVSVYPELRWTRGSKATHYKVAFGETNPPLTMTETNGYSFSPGELKPGTVYYWRVDQVTTDGVEEGEVWRFQTVPAKAWFEYPENSVTEGTSAVLLDWQPGAKAVAHRLYFAPENEPLVFVAEVESAPYQMHNLKYGTAYHWRVDEVTDQKTVQGDEWGFTTKETLNAGPGRVEAESMTLGDGYLIEAISDASGGRLAAKNSRNGWMVYTHQGVSGEYDVSVNYFNNSKGVSQFQMFVGDEMIAEWQSNEGENNNRYSTKVLSNVKIQQGEEIQIKANWINGDHLARVDWVETTLASQ